MAQHPSRHQLASEFECLYQAIHWKLVLEWANRAEERWGILNTDTANFVLGRTQWQTASQAMGTVPGQVCLARRADTDRA